VPRKNKNKNKGHIEVKKGKIYATGAIIEAKRGVKSKRPNSK
jgi:hypothetical protein